ncbi:hypothetical protein [Streptomyces sp. NBRC 110465]|uniref:hypothetical protein n=1 Tax=Streptomyces sp. NBRC 110465 TaxID=1897621 RepID=UPI0009321F7C|nr:hypothetical protein [Streptomyces sp. NBRC 110465]
MFVVAPRLPKKLRPSHAAWRAAQHAAALAGAALLRSAYPGLDAEDPEDPLCLTGRAAEGGKITVWPSWPDDLPGFQLDAEALPVPVAQLISDIVHGRDWFPLVKAGTNEPTGDIAAAEPGRYAQAEAGRPAAHELTIDDEGTVALHFPGLTMNAVLGALAVLRDPDAVRVHQAGCTLRNCTCQCPTVDDCRPCDSCACQCQCVGVAT